MEELRCWVVEAARGSIVGAFGTKHFFFPLVLIVLLISVRF